MFYLLNLQLFGEGGGEGAAPAASGSEGTQAVSQNATGKSRGALANVQYGIQESKTEEADTSKGAEAPEPVDRNAAFEQLIKGEYKEQFNARMQEAISKRFKNSEAVAERQKKLAPILEVLGNKYGVDISDIDKMDLDKLNKAIMEDDSYFEQEALEKGIPVETLKELKRMEAENKSMKEAMEARQRQEQNKKAYEELVRQSAQVKEAYPGFDLRTEMNNPNFGRLIAAGVDARTAYEVVHRDEIQPAMAQYMVQKTAEKISNQIQSGQRRVSENGVNSQSTPVVKTDVTKLTKADREEIARRVARGEKIRF